MEDGCVLRCETGVVVVLCDAGVVRASYGATLLGELARDRTCAPVPGEWVRLRHWPDGPATVERRLALRPRSDSVVPLRRRP